MVERLLNRFGETLQIQGVATGGLLMEVFVSANTGTWTILVSHPSGRSCVLSAGDGWTPIIRPQGTAA